jgi:hypothetical protein
VIWGAFGFQTREKVLDVGPIHASRDKEHNVPYGPLAGGLLAEGGVGAIGELIGRRPPPWQAAQPRRLGRGDRAGR